MGELKQGSLGSLDSKGAGVRDKETRELRSPASRLISIRRTGWRLLDLEAIKIQHADGASSPEQAHGRGCSRDC